LKQDRAVFRAETRNGNGILISLGGNAQRRGLDANLGAKNWPFADTFRTVLMPERSLTEERSQERSVQGFRHSREKPRGYSCFHARPPIKLTAPVIRLAFAAGPNFSSLLAESIKICLAAVLSRGWAPHLRRLGFFGKRKPHLPELIVCSPAR